MSLNVQTERWGGKDGRPCSQSPWANTQVWHVLWELQSLLFLPEFALPPHTLRAFPWESFLLRTHSHHQPRLSEST